MIDNQEKIIRELSSLNFKLKSDLRLKEEKLKINEDQLTEINNKFKTIYSENSILKSQISNKCNLLKMKCENSNLDEFVLLNDKDEISKSNKYT